MIFSRACENAIRATLYVATHSVGGPVPVREIAQATDIPAAYLAKIIQQLTRPGVLTSVKGPRGGVSLARPAKEMTLMEVVLVIEGHEFNRECVLGIPGCSEDVVHCPFHEQWGEIRERIMAMLSNRTIAQVAEQLAENPYVLSGDRVAFGKILGSGGARRRSGPRVFE